MKKLLLAFSVVALSAFSALAGSYPEISIEELKTAIDNKTVTIIDVNRAETYQKGHIPGAISFVADKEVIATKLPEDKTALIVAYCGSERCGAYARGAKAAEDLGYTNVKHLKAGLAGWKAAGLPLEKAE